MDNKLPILGLGPQVGLVRTLLEKLSSQAPLAPERVLLAEVKPEQYVETLIHHRPRILILSLKAKSLDLGGLPEYLEGLNPKFRPQIFFLLDQLGPVIQQKIEAKEPLELRSLGPVVFDNSSQIAFTDESEDDYLLITPKPQIRFADPQKQTSVGNLPLSAFEGFQWRDQFFAAEDFFELTSYLWEGEHKLPESKSFFTYQGELYLRSRYHLKEFSGLTLDGLSATHFKEIDDLAGENARLFEDKLKDTLLEESVWAFSGQLLGSTAWTQNQWPIHLKSDHQVLYQYMTHKLQEQGYQLDEKESSVELDITRQSSEVTWPSALWSIPFFEGLQDQPLEFDLPPETCLTSPQISRYRERLCRQKEHLAERQKAHEGAKLMAAQEEDIKIVAKRKLELLGQLMKRAEIFELDSDEMILTLGQDCMVFYEDDMIARKITRHLQGSGKSQFFDIGGFSNLQGLLTYKTDHLVPFLTHGHILVTKQSQHYLLKKLDKIAAESDQQKPARTNLTGHQLREEKNRLQEGFENLACLEAWNLCESALEGLEPQLQEGLKDRTHQRVKRIYSGLVHEMAFISHSAQVAEHFAAQLPQLSLHPLIGQPRPVPSSLEGDLQEAPVKRAHLDQFIQQTRQQLCKLSVDLVLIYHEPQLAQLMVQQFRQAPQMQGKGYMILFSQAPLAADLKQLIAPDCLPLFLGPHVSHLSQSWKFHLG